MRYELLNDNNLVFSRFQSLCFFCYMGSLFPFPPPGQVAGSPTREQVEELYIQDTASDPSKPVHLSGTVTLKWEPCTNSIGTFTAPVQYVGWLFVTDKIGHHIVPVLLPGWLSRDMCVESQLFCKIWQKIIFSHSSGECFSPVKSSNSWMWWHARTSVKSNGLPAVLQIKFQFKTHLYLSIIKSCPCPLPWKYEDTNVIIVFLIWG